MEEVGSRLMSFAGALGAAFLAAASAPASTSPSQLLASALAAARAQTSVHYVTTQTSRGRAVRIVGDAARDRGIQRITYRNGSRVGGVTVILVANTAYLRGDAYTLTHYMRIPAASAAKWAGKWLSFAHTLPDFSAVAAAVRLDSTLDALAMPRPLRAAGTTRRRGHRVVGIESRFLRAGHRVTETLYVDASGVPLPVEQIARSGTIVATGTFSRWNEHVAVVAPPGAIPVR
jgi:hypothetical protein